MKFSAISPDRVVSLGRVVPKARTGSLIVILMLTVVGSYAILDTSAHSAGITGQTQKSTTAGCSCHCASSNPNTSVSLTSSSGTSPLTAAPSTAYSFTVTVSNSSEAAAGVDIATYSGSGLAPGTGLQNGVSPNTTELTHTTPKAISGGTASWTFTYTTPSTSGWDTIYATGNAVDGHGDASCADEWNSAQKFIIHTVVPTKRFAFGRSSIDLGSVRVGRRKADSLLVRSTGQDPITINSNGMKSGVPFSFSTAGSTGRTLTTEVDSAIFQPTSRGTFSDSIIFTTNSDTIPDQRKGVAVSGQGIQAVFSNALSSLAFGNLRINRTATMAFPFSNGGDDTMFLSTPTLYGTGFTITQQPHQLTLAPGVFDTVIVQFAPTAKQSYSGSLSFSASNGVSTPTISLSGSGVVPQIQYVATASIGGIRVGYTLAPTIPIRNTGNDTLHLSNVSLTQTGTKFTLGAYDQTILPGGQGVIHIQYTPNAERTDSAQIHFTSDDPANVSGTMLVIGSGVLPHMSLADHDTVDMGTVKVLDVASRIFTINNTGGDGLTISGTNTSAGPSPFALSTTGGTFIPTGSSGSLTVTFAPTSVGTFTGLLIVAGDDPNNPLDTIPLKGTAINSSLRISPSSALFGSVPVSTTVYDTIALSNTGAAAVNISNYKLVSAPKIFKLVDSAKQVAGNGTARIILSFTPQDAIAYSGVLTLTTDDNNAPSRTINLAGTGLKGALAVSPNVLDFGNVDSGKTFTQRAVFRNTGTAAVTVNSFDLSQTGSAFNDSKPTVPATIAAGDSLSVNITFAPITGGKQTGTLTATLPDKTSIAVQLLGVGVMPDHTGGNAVAETRNFTLALSLAPNPAKDITSLRISLFEEESAVVRVFDAGGREVRSEFLGRLAPGEHDVSLSTSFLPSGIYFVRVEGGNGRVTEGRLVVDR